MHTSFSENCAVIGRRLDEANAQREELRAAYERIEELERLTKPTLVQLCAASAMHARLEWIVGLGALPGDLEIDTRVLIQRAGKAFELDSIAERPTEPKVREFMR